MSARKPPALAMWLLHHFGMGYHGESLAGDLIEQYQHGCSRYWCWKQVIIAVVIARVRAISCAFHSGTRILSRWMQQPERRRRLINKLLGAFVATALGAGAVTWAGTIGKAPCRTSICVGEQLQQHSNR